MNKVLTPEIQDLIDAVHYRPAVSIIMPYEPKINFKPDLIHSLKVAADNVEKDLLQNYPEELGRLVIDRLRTIISKLNINTHKKSIALFVSPLFEKVVYLDIAVEEKVIIDESFEIRDLVYSKKQMNKYLVLVLSAKESKIYLGNTDRFIKIVTNSAEELNAIPNENKEKVANFGDASERKEIMMDKFLRYIDNSLESVLYAYQLPLFVLGTERLLGHFKTISKHKDVVIQYIHGNYEEASFPQLKEILQPHLNDWKLGKQKEILLQLEEAAGKKKLFAGIKDVWHEAMNQNGRLLVVEKNYMVPAQHGNWENVIHDAVEQNNKFSLIKDAVDDIMEKVLENGGDVEFVDKGMLNNYHHIALVTFY